jgi:S-adenosylmethionine:tRNA ribosyltransferase-isomerase
MKTESLDFAYPEGLIATSRQKISRVMWVQESPEETTLSQLLSRFKPEDLLVINETKVIKARVICASGLEVLFIRDLGPDDKQENGENKTQWLWEVLCPARRWSKSGEVLPCGTPIELKKTGLPQLVSVPKELDFSYFEKYGDVPLPPYIQEKRGERKSRETDITQYQTAWAKTVGSLAAPTASLHFSSADIDKIRARGVDVAKLCLHVGLGTFLPIHTDNLDEHVMHGEWVSIPAETLRKIEVAKKNGGRVWALGTTVLRGLESYSHGKLDETEFGAVGVTDLFIKPGFEFKIVDVLLTNFHQPKSTLLALVGAFAGLDKVKAAYQWAIDREFRLFSYGDLTVWIR